MQLANSKWNLWTPQLSTASEFSALQGAGLVDLGGGEQIDFRNSTLSTFTTGDSWNEAGSMWETGEGTLSFQIQIHYAFFWMPVTCKILSHKIAHLWKRRQYSTLRCCWIWDLRKLRCSNFKKSWEDKVQGKDCEQGNCYCCLTSWF